MEKYWSELLRVDFSVAVDSSNMWALVSSLALLRPRLMKSLRNLTSSSIRDNLAMIG